MKCILLLNVQTFRNVALIDLTFPILSFFLPDVLCDPTDLIWRQETPFEAMTGRTASSSDSFLAEAFWGFLSFKANARRYVHSPQDYFIITLIISYRRD